MAEASCLVRGEPASACYRHLFAIENQQTEVAYVGTEKETL
jgi:hypothetical protein